MSTLLLWGIACRVVWACSYVCALWYPSALRSSSWIRSPPPTARLAGTLLVVRGVLRRGVPQGFATVVLLTDPLSCYAAHERAGQGPR